MEPREMNGTRDRLCVYVSTHMPCAHSSGVCRMAVSGEGDGGVGRDRRLAWRG
jgi:hypothetical protein